MPVRRRRGTLALIALTLGWALIMQSLGWAQTSYYAFVKALGDGNTSIDAYHWETRDKSYIDGHFYSVKAPGLPLMLAPEYLALNALGAKHVSADAAAAAKRGGAQQWSYRALNVHAYGYDRANAIRTKSRMEREAPMVWVLGLFGTVLPAFLLMLLVRRRIETFEPGLGALTAVTLGGATLIMPFAVNLFGHVMAALLSFAAFALAWHERERVTPRVMLVLLAGLLSGLAVTTEYPLAIAGAVIGLYALLRPDVMGAGATRTRLLARRGAAYAGGVVLGVVPLLIYNLVAFGSVSTLSYKNAVNEQGRTGHETLGLNSGGFFGIGMPAPRQALDLLISPRGILVLIPIVVMAIVGTVLLYRRGRRAEALVIGAVSLGYYVYDSGYWLPMGGGSPGPAVPDPDAAVPRRRPGLRVEALPGADAGARDPLGGDDDRRDDHLPADRARRLGAVVGAGEARQLPALAAERLRPGQRLARHLARAARVRRGGLPGRAIGARSRAAPRARRQPADARCLGPARRRDRPGLRRGGDLRRPRRPDRQDHPRGGRHPRARRARRGRAGPGRWVAAVSGSGRRRGSRPAGAGHPDR